MKKIAKLFIVSLLLISCKKVYTCECTTVSTITDPSFSGLIDDMNSTTSYQTEKMKEKDAKAKCESGNTETNMMFFKTTTECELKL